jgi:hypothetical protein
LLKRYGACPFFASLPFRPRFTDLFENASQDALEGFDLLLRKPGLDLLVDLPYLSSILIQGGRVPVLLKMSPVFRIIIDIPGSFVG